MDNNLLYNSLCKFYSNNKKSKYLLKYLKYEKISLRIIDWFVTNFSKKYDILYSLFKDDNELSLEKGEIYTQFNVFHSYKAQLKSYSKKIFDPFCRRNKILFYCDNLEISTTLGQLNFFKWAINNLVIEYILKNYDDIEIDMNESIQKIRKNYIKTSERKKRQELSLSATRGLSRTNISIKLNFD